MHVATARCETVPCEQIVPECHADCVVVERAWRRKKRLKELGVLALGDLADDALVEWKQVVWGMVLCVHRMESCNESCQRKQPCKAVRAHWPCVLCHRGRTPLVSSHALLFSVSLVGCVCTEWLCSRVCGRLGLHVALVASAHSHPCLCRPCAGLTMDESTLFTPQLPQSPLRDAVPSSGYGKYTATPNPKPTDRDWSVSRALRVH